MKKVVWTLLMCLELVATGCAREMVYSQPPTVYQTGTVEFCDDWGCRNVEAPYYYDDGGAVVYWDAHFGCWVGSGHYWYGGVWHPGFVGGYHEWYGRGFYHSFGYHGGGWRAGSGWHGGYHGGHGGHR